MVPSGEGGGGVMSTVIIMGSFFAILYFLLWRPQRQQQKRQEEMVRGLKRGDEVSTVGGIVGRIIHVKEDRLTIKTADDTRVVIERDKVSKKYASAEEE